MNTVDYDIIHNQTSRAQQTHLPNIHRKSTINTTPPPPMSTGAPGGWLGTPGRGLSGAVPGVVGG